MGKRPKRSDITGLKSGKLTAIEKVGYDVDKNGKRYALWLCKCDCGGEKVCSQHSLVTNAIKSCGCLRNRKYDKPVRHGMSHTRIYHIYRGMLDRCYLKNDCHYYRYGGRGIKVTDEWQGRNGFLNFYKWAMENGYSDELTIDRINVNGNYEPDNCRWATHEQQSNNQRTNVFYIVNGERLQIKQIAKKYNVSEDTLRRRMRKFKLSMQEAVDYKPPRKYENIKYHGEVKSSKEWSKITGIPQKTIEYRIKQGYTEEELFLPAKVGYDVRRSKKQHYKEV